MTGRFEERVALVTGGSSGIGTATAGTPWNHGSGAG
jgi:NAD(P)-dependent dehydrogenase (short-subunit alcohol dehydrogenase family)